MYDILFTYQWVDFFDAGIMHLFHLASYSTI